MRSVSTRRTLLIRKLREACQGNCTGLRGFDECLVDLYMNGELCDYVLYWNRISYILNCVSYISKIYVAILCIWVGSFSAVKISTNIIFRISKLYSKLSLYSNFIRQVHSYNYKTRVQLYFLLGFKTIKSYLVYFQKKQI
jgi:hypothetical protein